jgi:hypothetical protein
MNSLSPRIRLVGPPFRRLFPDDKSARKNLLLKILCNPLISLDPDERIQGNPTPKTWGFRAEMGRSKKTQTGSTNGAATAVEKEPNRLHPNAQRSNRSL